MYNMRQDFEKAKQLRIKGFSYKEISKELGIPMSTLSGWFSKNRWSQDIVLRNNKKALPITLKRLSGMHKARRKKLDEYYKRAKSEAVEEFKENRHDPLFIAGLCLYWGEGDKRTLHQLRITNSDPNIIKIFHIFIQRYFLEIQPSRIRANVFIYPDLDDITCKNFWSTHIKLTLKQFTKSTLLQGRSSNRLKYGTCTLTISSRFLKEKMIEWLRLLEKEW